MKRLHPIAGGALATALVAAAPSSAQIGAGPVSPPGLPQVPATKVVAIGHVTDRWTPEAIRTVMPREVRETVALYLQGKVDQWFMRKDRPGVVFVFNASDVAEVHALLEALPLGRERMMEFDLIPLGPLAPLGLLTTPPGAPTSGKP